MFTVQVELECFGAKKGKEMMCETNRRKDVLAIDMVGRAAMIHGKQYVLCPICCKIHGFRKKTDAWVSECCQEHAITDRKAEGGKSDGAGKRRKKGHKCPVCDESGQSPPVERVDHMSGKMHQLWYCVRHFPPKTVMEHCVNLKQINLGWINTLHNSTSRSK